MATYKNYTIDEIRFVKNNWDTMTISKLAEGIGRTPTSISYIAQEIRKAGFPLPRKSVKREYTLKALIHQALGGAQA